MHRRRQEQEREIQACVAALGGAPVPERVLADQLGALVALHRRHLHRPLREAEHAVAGREDDAGREQSPGAERTLAARRDHVDQNRFRIRMIMDAAGDREVGAGDLGLGPAAAEQRKGGDGVAHEFEFSTHGKRRPSASDVPESQRSGARQVNVPL